LGDGGPGGKAVLTPAEELRRIVKESGGNFTASVFLREDGFFTLCNLSFFDRIARSGRLARFCELLKIQFGEAIDNAQKETCDSNGGAVCICNGSGARELSGVQVGN